MATSENYFILLVLQHNGVQKELFFHDNKFCFNSQEAHLVEGMNSPSIITIKHSFNSFECAFIQFCRFYPVFNFHLTYIHEDYKNELKSLIPHHSENDKSVSIKSRSWQFIMI